mmetsp:Transcript_22151/g.53125  ORF Transcript_22151/g.53125 Transcript_22151/m.53125 type:complete len:253 (+) Transcript_22151:903-1661(+)
MMRAPVLKAFCTTATAEAGTFHSVEMNPRISAARTSASCPLVAAASNASASFTYFAFAARLAAICMPKGSAQPGGARNPPCAPCLATSAEISPAADALAPHVFSVASAQVSTVVADASGAASTSGFATADAPFAAVAAPVASLTPTWPVACTSSDTRFPTSPLASLLMPLKGPVPSEHAKTTPCCRARTPRWERRGSSSPRMTPATIGGMSSSPSACSRRAITCSPSLTVGGLSMSAARDGNDTRVPTAAPG